MFWRLLYNSVIVPLGWLVFHFLALFDRKVREGLRGRKRLFDDLAEKLERINPDAQRVWFHASSMGEFEQAKPIIEELKRRKPSVEVIVTFFSPSGYKHSLHYHPASVISYIPFDSLKNARRFVGMVRPSAAVIVRYDIWPNHVWELRRRSVPTFIASATLQQSTARKLPFLRQFHRELYNALDYILTVSEKDQKVFESFHLKHPVVRSIGDTRYDQVTQRSSDARKLNLLPQNVIDGKRVLIIGSSWREDEDRILPACINLLKQQSNIVVILVPHEPTLDNLEYIEENLNGQVTSIRMSRLQHYAQQKIVVVDSVGILMPIYRYASVVYVGGGFGSGVHNVLEPASYGVPIIVGPHHENSQECVRMVREGGAFVGNDAQELSRHFLSFFSDENLRRCAGQKALDLVRNNTGATERFLSYLEKLL